MCSVPICPPGKMLDTRLNPKRCVDCPKGFYQDQDQQTICTQCPPDTSTEGTGSKSKDDCTNRYVRWYLYYKYAISDILYTELDYTSTLFISHFQNLVAAIAKTPLHCVTKTQTAGLLRKPMAMNADVKKVSKLTV